MSVVLDPRNRVLETTTVQSATYYCTLLPELYGDLFSRHILVLTVSLYNDQHHLAERPKCATTKVSVEDENSQLE